MNTDSIYLRVAGCFVKDKTCNLHWIGLACERFQINHLAIIAAESAAV